MRASDSSMGGEADQFHTTRWTLVMASAQDQSQTSRAALAALCEIYWYPPEKIFEARWALTLLNHALTVLRQEYVARGKESVFDTLKAFVGIGESRLEVSYEEAAKGLDIGVGTVKTLIHRLRRHCLAVVREEVARTVSNPAGAKLLGALGVKGDEEKLRSASDEFSGHCLALTLLGSYLTDAYNGDIRCREEVSKRLAHDVLYDRGSTRERS